MSPISTFSPPNFSSIPFILFSSPSSLLSPSPLIAYLLQVHQLSVSVNLHINSSILLLHSIQHLLSHLPFLSILLLPALFSLFLYPHLTFLSFLSGLHSFLISRLLPLFLSLLHPLFLDMLIPHIFLALSYVCSHLAVFSVLTSLMFTPFTHPPFLFISHTILVSPSLPLSIPDIFLPSFHLLLLSHLLSHLRISLKYSISTIISCSPLSPSPSSSFDSNPYFNNSSSNCLMAQVPH